VNSREAAEKFRHCTHIRKNLEIRVSEGETQSGSTGETVFATVRLFNVEDPGCLSSTSNLGFLIPEKPLFMQQQLLPFPKLLGSGTS
jgi:hypothetical protein